MDHPANKKRVGMHLYYKGSLLPKVIDASYLQKCINFEVEISDKKMELPVSVDLLAKQKMNFRIS